MRRLLAGGLALFAALLALDVLAPHATSRALLDFERARSGLERKVVRVADLDVVYLDGGSGAPLVLVHGFGADKDNFTPVARYLTPHYRVIVPDLPGFGESSKPASAPYTIEAQADRLRAFVRALGLQRVHLGGSSMGGFIATRYAIAHPGEVESLWLLGPAGTAAAFDSELTREIARTGRNPLLARTRDEFARTLDFVMARRPFMPRSVVRTLADAAAANHPLHARIFEVVGPGTPTLDEQLVGLRTPALVVFGARDRALNPKAGAVYEAAMPNAEVVVMDGIGHLPMLEAPQETAAAYRAFRAGLRAAAPRAQAPGGRPTSHATPTEST